MKGLLACPLSGFSEIDLAMKIVCLKLQFSCFVRVAVTMHHFNIFYSLNANEGHSPFMQPKTHSGFFRYFTALRMFKKSSCKVVLK